MILRKHRSSPAPCALAIWVFVIVCLLLYAPRVQASSGDPTFTFLLYFRDHLPKLKALWPQKNINYCSWEYISCNATTGLASLELSGLDLEGRYPQVNGLDGSMILIESINMSFNLHLRSKLRYDWSKLSHLRVLDLSSTDTYDDLPNDWGYLSNLEFLNLSNTNVRDSIPDEWEALENLVVLDLHRTEVDELSVVRLGLGMKHLEVLLLSETSVSNILDDLTSPTYFESLRILDVSNPVNTKTGELSSDLAIWAVGLANLTYVGFDGYGFTGCVPNSYRSVPVLMQSARRANIGLVLSQSKCASYKCTSPMQLNADTRAFLQVLKASPFMQAAAAASWSGEDYCRWQGVDCPRTCGVGISLNLSALPLSGSIPDVFTGIDGTAVLIDSFVINNNSGVVGALPPSLVEVLSLARKVELSTLAILGTLPTVFGASLRYVEYLAITHTRLCGSLPTWDDVHSPPLHYADLSSNHMGGTLDSSWAALPLETVDLRKNFFCGCVPDSWLDKPLLMRSLDSAMTATGTDPACAFVNGCGNLNQQCNSVDEGSVESETAEFLEALRRSFPKQLTSWGKSPGYCGGSWRGITCSMTADGVTEVAINLSGAQLDGSLPEVPVTAVGSRVLLASIDMSNNPSLTGSLPASWGKLSYLRTLNLNDCAVGGDLPNAWEGMRRLEELYISGSKLCRGLPNWEADNMPNLKYFDVSANTMYGGLTESLGSFGPQLKYFNVTKNKFCGCIPSTWKSYQVLVVGVDNDAATLKCALASNACGRFAMRCESVDDTLLNFMDVNWNFLDVIKKHLGTDLDATASHAAVDIFSTWNDYEFCNYGGVLCKFNTGNNGFALDLGGVGLKGSLPSISSHFKSAVAARTIDLSNNPWITGTLPPSWGELTNLLYLDLSNTSVASVVPTSWQGMHNLLFLSVARTQVCGLLPSWSANQLVSVLSLDFSHSKLAGTLSDEWGTFGASELATLNLQGNTGLCSCAPSAWLKGQILPNALIATFGTIPQISDSCASSCSSPPSCVNPEGDDPSNGLAGQRSVPALHAAAVFAAVLFAW